MDGGACMDIIAIRTRLLGHSRAVFSSEWNARVIRPQNHDLGVLWRDLSSRAGVDRAARFVPEWA